MARGPADVGRPDARDDEDVHETAALPRARRAARATRRGRGRAARPIRREREGRDEHGDRCAGHAPLARRGRPERQQDERLDTVRDDPQAGPADRDRERLRPAEHELQRGGDEHDARRVDRALVVRAEERRRTSHGIATRKTGTETTTARRRGQDVAPHAREDGVLAPRSQSRVCSVSRIRRTGALAAAKPVCGACATRNRPTWVGLATTPSRSGASVVPQRDDARRDARLEHERRARVRRSSPSGRCGARGKRRNAGRPGRADVAVAITCATTITTTAAVTPNWVPIAMPASRSPRERPGRSRAGRSGARMRSAAAATSSGACDERQQRRHEHGPGARRRRRSASANGARAATNTPPARHPASFTCESARKRRRRRPQSPVVT